MPKPCEVSRHDIVRLEKLMMFMALSMRRIEGGIRQLLNEEMTMSQAVDDLKAAVAAEGTVVDSAVALITSLVAQVEANANDPAALADLLASVKAQTAELAAAVPQNTPTDTGGGSTGSTDTSGSTGSTDTSGSTDGTPPSP